MLIVSSPRIRLEKILPFATKVGVALSILFSVCYVFFLCLPLHLEKREKCLLTLKDGISSKLFVFSLDKIGQGPLSLSPLKHHSVMPDLSQEILVLSKGVKTSASDAEDLLIQLKSSKLTLKIKSGDLVFLSCDPGSGEASSFYRFSDKKTPLWIRPSFLGENKAIVEVGLFLPSKESESFVEEKGQFILQAGTLPLSEKERKSTWFDMLYMAKLWGTDHMLAKYGGEKYRVFRDRLKLEIPKAVGSSFYFLKEGDVLVWNEGFWTDIDKVESLERKPLAQVKGVSPREMEIEVCGEDGFYSQTIKFSLQSDSRSLKPEILPHSVRMKNSTQIACCFGKRKYLLKEGDWVLKTTRGWRVLKRPVDLEDYFCHKLRGELYIFESLSKEQGKLTMKGVWIDEMRTGIQSFSVPVLGKPNETFLGRKERKPSSPRKTSSFAKVQRGLV